MKKTVDKEILVRNFFSFKAEDVKGREVLVKKISTYLSENEPDSELECIQIALKAVREFLISHDFNKCCKIAAPMFKALLVKNNPSFTELTTWAMILHYASYEQSKSCAEKILAALDSEFSRERKRESVKFIVYCNMVKRLLHAKHPSYNATKCEASWAEIRDLFRHYAAQVYDTCEKHNAFLMEAVTNVREGIFFVDIDLIDKGLEWIKKGKDDSLFKAIRLELLEYSQHLGDNISKAPLDIIVGYNIAKMRNEMGMSQGDVAGHIEMRRNSYAAIERGFRGATLTTLFKLAQLFDVPETYFFHGHKKDFAFGNKINSDPTAQKMSIILRNASDSEKEYAINMVELYAKSFLK